MPDESGNGDWTTAAIALLSTAIGGLFGYLAKRRKQGTEDLRVVEAAKVELRKADVEEDRTLAPLVMTMFEGMKSRIQELEASQAKRDQDFRDVWHGMVARGFLEGEKTQHIILRAEDDRRWFELSKDARQTYAEIAGDLKEIRRELRTKIGREPTDDELSWAIKSDFDDWMLTHACRSLGVNDHGCIAIACVIARENGSDMHA